MAVRGYYYNSVNFDRPYNGEDMNEDKAPFYKEGVVYGHLAVTAGERMTVNVDGGKKTGYAYINMHTIHNTTVLPLTVSQASGTLPRIDRVILQNNQTERKPSIFILEGQYSSNPQPPELTNTDVIQEKCLAEIYVAAGTVEITQADITDTRADPVLCGYVASQFEDFDFSQFTLQFNSWFYQKKTAIEDEYAKFIEEYKELKEAFINEEQEAIIRWFNNIKGQLSEDAALRLQMQINELSTELKEQKESTQGMVTDAFSTEADYVASDYCIFNDTLYRFTKEKNAGEWDPEAVQATTIAEQLSGLNSKLTEIKNRLGGLTFSGMTQSEYDDISPEDKHVYFVVPDSQEEAAVLDTPLQVLPAPADMAVAVTLPEEGEVE